MNLNSSFSKEKQFRVVHYGEKKELDLGCVKMLWYECDKFQLYHKYEETDVEFPF